MKESINSITQVDNSSVFPDTLGVIKNKEQRIMEAIQKLDEWTEGIKVKEGERWYKDRFGENKAKHMQKMAFESETAIEELGLEKDDELKPYLHLYKFIARAHDIGRHLWKDKDYKNIDHGEIAVELLRNNGIINCFTNNEQEVIEYAIRNHSAKEMTDPKTEVEKQGRKICIVLRDNDKLEVINNRDFVEAEKIYDLLAIHFGLNKLRAGTQSENEKTNSVDFIQSLLRNKDSKPKDQLQERIKEIVSRPLVEKFRYEGEKLNIIELLENRKPIPQAAYKSTMSYVNYLLFLVSYIYGIEHQSIIQKVSVEEIQIKMDFIRERATVLQYQRIKDVVKSVSNLDIL